MTTNPNRRRFIQGEVLNPMKFINDPDYFQFRYSNFDIDNAYYGYSGFIVPSNYPNKTLYNLTSPGNERPAIFGHTSISVGCGTYCEIFRMGLPAGIYKIGLFKYMTQGYENYTYIMSLPNSTFTVVQNNFTISLNQNTYKKGDTFIPTLSSNTYLSSPFYFENDPIFYAISNRDYGGNFNRNGMFYPDESSNQRLIGESVVLDSDEIGTFSVKTTFMDDVKEFTVTSTN